MTNSNKELEDAKAEYERTKAVIERLTGLKATTELVDAIIKAAEDGTEIDTDDFEALS